jgi:hypothetical protein
VKDAAIWAVNRNAVYEAAEGRSPQMASSTIYFIRALATTIGAAASGIVIEAEGDWPNVPKDSEFRALG